MGRKLQEETKILLTALVITLIGVICAWLFSGCGTTKEYHTHEYTTVVTTNTYTIDRSTVIYQTPTYYFNKEVLSLVPQTTAWYYIDIPTTTYNTLWQIMEQHNISTIIYHDPTPVECSTIPYVINGSTES